MQAASAAAAPTTTTSTAEIEVGVAPARPKRSATRSLASVPGIGGVILLVAIAGTFVGLYAREVSRKEVVSKESPAATTALGAPPRAPGAPPLPPPPIQPAIKLEGIDVAEIRLLLQHFVSELTDAQREHAYYADASLQPQQWLLCTIVQNCLDAEFGISAASLSSKARSLFFRMLSQAMPAEAYTTLLEQIQANLVLGQYQMWASTCPGLCKRVPNAPVPNVVGGFAYIRDLDDATGIPNITDFFNCSAEFDRSRDTTWVCNEAPLQLYGNLNTSDGEFLLNNIFYENMVHWRSSEAEFVSVYGAIIGKGQFGFRYSGHHFDVSYTFHEDGSIDDLPWFLGHNPVHVFKDVPPEVRHTSDIDHGDVTYDLWANLRGVILFPTAVNNVLDFSNNFLPASAFVPLNEFDTRADLGLLVLKGGRQLMNAADVPNGNAVNLSSVSNDEFQIVWKMVTESESEESELGSSFRSARKRMARDEFRSTGRLMWTSFDRLSVPTSYEKLESQHTMLYVQIETPNYFYYMWVNLLFTFVAANEPSNHIHAMFAPKMPYLHSVLP